MRWCVSGSKISLRSNTTKENGQRKRASVSKLFVLTNHAFYSNRKIAFFILGMKHTTRSHTQPHAATRSHTQPHAATRNHTQPHATTRNHTQPHTTTHNHTQPHTTTHSHTQPLTTTRNHTQPHATTRNHTQPLAAHAVTQNHIITEGEEGK